MGTILETPEEFRLPLKDIEPLKDIPTEFSSATQWSRARKLGCVICETMHELKAARGMLPEYQYQYQAHTDNIIRTLLLTLSNNRSSMSVIIRVRQP